MKSIILLLGLSLSASALGQVELQSCTDCFNFTAPSVLGADSVSPAEIGLIVNDTEDDSIKAYTNAGWSKLSNELIMTSQTSAYTISNEDLVLADASSSGFTLTLPPAASSTGKILMIKKTDSTFNSIVIDADSIETIDNALTVSLHTENESIKLTSDGSNWRLLQRHIPSNYVSYTPTGSWTSNTTYSGHWYRDGKFFVSHVRVNMSGSPGPATTRLEIDLPTGLSVASVIQDQVSLGDMTLVTSSSGFRGKVVYVGSTDSIGTRFYRIASAPASSTDLIKEANLSTGNGEWSFGSGDYVVLDIRVPIAGWSN